MRVYIKLYCLIMYEYSLEKNIGPFTYYNYTLREMLLVFVHNVISDV